MSSVTITEINDLDERGEHILALTMRILDVVEAETPDVAAHAAVNACAVIIDNATNPGAIADAMIDILASAKAWTLSRTEGE